MSSEEVFAGISARKRGLLVDAVAKFKRIISAQLCVLQGNKCAYCGSSLYVTSSREIEHIAAKGGAKRPRHVEFTFLPYNLVFACRLCNSTEKKGQLNTVTVKNVNYSACTFSIVHPYFDDPTQHYAWFGPIIKGKTSKGFESIRMFRLDGEALTVDRQKTINHEAIKRILSSDDIDLIHRVLEYR